MARLADEILRRVDMPEWIRGSRQSTPGEHLAMDRVHEYLCSQLISGIPILDVTNVADYVWRQTEQWSTTDPNEFPCLTPPFPTFWTEYRRPSVFVHERDDLKDPDSTWNRNPRGRRLKGRWVEAHTDDWLIERYGVLWESVDLETQSLDDLQGAFTNKEGVDPVAAWLPDGTRWVLRGSLYIKERTGDIQGPMAYWIGALDDHGVLIKDAALGMPAVEYMDPEQHFYWKTMLLPTFQPMLRAICYLHCKNIQAEVHKPPQKLAKKQKKQKGRPTLTFRTLVIEPMMKGGKSSHGGGGGGAKSHHFVRGHFADYREKGLFGKWKNIYWFDMHMRGSKEVGEVIGDYEVHAPEEEAG